MSVICLEPLLKKTKEKVKVALTKIDSSFKEKVKTALFEIETSFEEKVKIVSTEIKKSFKGMTIYYHFRRKYASINKKSNNVYNTSRKSQFDQSPDQISIRPDHPCCETGIACDEVSVCSKSTKSSKRQNRSSTKAPSPSKISRRSFQRTNTKSCNSDYAKLSDLPVELIYKISEYGVPKSLLMILSSQFLDIFAPEVYRNVHAICCLRVNKYAAGEEFEAFTRDKSFAQLDRYWAVRGDSIEVVESRPIDKDILGDYRHRRTTLITSFDTLEFFFRHVLNGKSRLKKYVKNFTMDFAFINTIGTDFLYTKLIDHELRRWSANSKIIQLSNPSNFITYDFRYILAKKLQHMRFDTEKDKYKALVELSHGYGYMINDRRTKQMLVLTQLFDNYFTGKRFLLYDKATPEKFIRKFDPFNDVHIKNVGKKETLRLYREFGKKCEVKTSEMEFPVSYMPEIVQLKKTIRMMISTFHGLPRYTRGQLFLVDIASSKTLANSELFQIHKPVCKVVNVNF